MLGINQRFPQFSGVAVSAAHVQGLDVSNAFEHINNESFAGKWLVMFFYPKDFTFVCPTEIAGFSELVDEFAYRNAEIVATSVDSEFTHWAWRKYNPALADLRFRMYSDVRRDLSASLGILDHTAGVSNRAVYIVDPEGYIKFVMVTDLNVGRNPSEVLRVLDALQSGELCPCSWSKGKQTIDLSKETV